MFLRVGATAQEAQGGSAAISAFVEVSAMREFVPDVFEACDRLAHGSGFFPSLEDSVQCS